VPLKYHARLIRAVRRSFLSRGAFIYRHSFSSLAESLSLSLSLSFSLFSSRFPDEVESRLRIGSAVEKDADLSRRGLSEDSTQ